MSAAKKIDTISLDEAVEMADQFFNFNSEKHGHVYQKSYLYNLLCSGKLTRHGPPHRALLNKQEFQSWLESKTKK